MRQCLSALLGLILSLLITACGPQGAGDSQFTPLDENALGKNGQIVGGKEVQSKSAASAYVTMIYGETAEGTPFVCTGTFISDEVILTAGHCVVDDVSMLTLSFSVNPFNDSEVVTLPVKAVVRHEKYHSESQVASDRNDVALIQFTGGLPKRAKAASLPAITDAKPFAIDNLLALGYGRTEGREDSENSSEEIGILRSVRISLEASEKNFAADNNNFIANQKNKKGVCSGDSGGPLMDTQNNKYTVMAISSGIFSADKEEVQDACQQKSVFMNVRFYLPWIQTQMENLKQSALAENKKKSVLDKNPAITPTN